MKWKNVLFAAATASLLWSCAAEPTCESTCEQQADCAMPPTDCVAGCEEGGQRAEAAGCGETHIELLSCLDAADDICDPSACAEETSAFLDCSCPEGSCLQ